MLKAATTGIGFQGKKKLFVYIEAIWTIPKVYYFLTPYWKASYTKKCATGKTSVLPGFSEIERVGCSSVTLHYYGASVRVGGNVAIDDII